MNRITLPRAVRLVGAILLCEAAGGIGVVASSDAINTWYRTLEKPAFNPPDRVFGPVWTTLYLLMGIALYVVSTGGADRRLLRPAQAIFGAQLALNTGWTLLFFGRRSPLYGLVEIVFLWLAVAATVVFFFRVSRLAGALLLPYLLWTTFAAMLNFEIWRLNSDTAQ